jgi:hypothetical protein
MLKTNFIRTMKETKEKPKSWIEEAWEYSRMAIENDLPTTIDAFYEYQSKKNVQMHQAHSADAREVKAHSYNGKIS